MKKYSDIIYWWHLHLLLHNEKIKTTMELLYMYFYYFCNMILLQIIRTLTANTIWHLYVIVQLQIDFIKYFNVKFDEYIEWRENGIYIITWIMCLWGLYNWLLKSFSNHLPIQLLYVYITKRGNSRAFQCSQKRNPNPFTIDVWCNYVEARRTCLDVQCLLSACD